MEKRRVVITGLGTVNPLGNNVSASWDSAMAGKCGIGPITQFDASEFKCKLAGEVKNFDPETVVDKKEARKMARFTLLALRDQFAPPTIHYEQPDPECNLDYVPNTGRSMKMEYALSNSLGFGGHNACLVFRKWEG